MSLRKPCFEPKSGYLIKMRARGSRANTCATPVAATIWPGTRSFPIKSRGAWPSSVQNRMEPTGNESVPRAGARIVLADQKLTPDDDEEGTPDLKPISLKSSVVTAPCPCRPKVGLINYNTELSQPVASGRPTDTVKVESASDASKETDFQTKRFRSSIDRRKSMGMQRIPTSTSRAQLIVKLPVASPCRHQPLKQRSVSTTPPVPRLRYTHAQRPTRAYSAVQSCIAELRPEVRTAVIESKQKPSISSNTSKPAETPACDRQTMLDDESIAIWLVNDCNTLKRNTSDDQSNTSKLEFSLRNRMPARANRISKLRSMSYNGQVEKDVAASCGFCNSYSTGIEPTERTVEAHRDTNRWACNH